MFIKLIRNDFNARRSYVASPYEVSYPIDVTQITPPFGRLFVFDCLHNAISFLRDEVANSNVGVHRVKFFERACSSLEFWEVLTGPVYESPHRINRDGLQFWSSWWKDPKSIGDCYVELTPIGTYTTPWLTLDRLVARFYDNALEVLGSVDI